MRSHTPLTETAAWKHEHEFVNTTTRWDKYPLQMINSPWYLAHMTGKRETSITVNARMRRRRSRETRQLVIHPRVTPPRCKLIIPKSTILTRKLQALSFKSRCTTRIYIKYRVGSDVASKCASCFLTRRAKRRAIGGRREREAPQRSVYPSGGKRKVDARIQME